MWTVHNMKILSTQYIMILMSYILLCGVTCFSAGGNGIWQTKKSQAVQIDGDVHHKVKILFRCLVLKWFVISGETKHYYYSALRKCLFFPVHHCIILNIEKELITKNCMHKTLIFSCLSKNYLWFLKYVGCVWNRNKSVSCNTNNTYNSIKKNNSNKRMINATERTIWKE